MSALLLASVLFLRWPDATGTPVQVEVRVGEPCPWGVHRACTDVLRNVIYLNRNLLALSHELAHISGMRHTDWYVNGLGVPCTRVTEEGYNTTYKIGQYICVGFNGEEFIE